MASNVDGGNELNASSVGASNVSCPFESSFSKIPEASLLLNTRIEFEIYLT